MDTTQSSNKQKRPHKLDKRRKYHEKFCILFLPSLIPRLREISKVETDVLLALASLAEINCYVKTSLKELISVTGYHTSTLSSALQSLCEKNFIFKINDYNSLYEINPDYIWIGSADEYWGVSNDTALDQGLELINVTIKSKDKVFDEFMAPRHEYDTAYLNKMLAKKKLQRKSPRKEQLPC